MIIYREASSEGLRLRAPRDYWRPAGPAIARCHYSGRAATSKCELTRPAPTRRCSHTFHCLRIADAEHYPA